jgi:hypothetical protein
LYDLDGSLTGLGPKTWATPYYKYNEQPECQVNMAVYDGIICDSTVQVRRIAMFKAEPGIFSMMEIKLIKWDDSIIKSLNSD